MAQDFNNPTKRMKLFLVLLFWICFQAVLVLADNCPQPCSCRDDLNLHVNCSNKLLLSPPTTISASTLTLDLSHNALGPVLNVSFAQMRSLHLIDLSQNALTHLLDCTFSGMLGLKTVRLRENRLTSLPEGLFTDTTQVEHLDLSHNLFVQLPQDVMKHLPALKTFDVSHNLISELRLGPRFQVPRHIEAIDLSYNQIEAIRTDSFEIASQWEASTGRTINLAFCRLSTIESGAITKIPNINDLDLTGNNEITLEMLKDLVKELESGARNLDRLSLGYLNLTSLVPLFSHVSEISLKFLNVSFNNISNVPLDVFSTIRSLRVLDLSRNSVTRLAAGFSDLSNLKVLNISHNRMESFQGDAISHLSNLQTLDLSYNKLTHSNRVLLSPLINLLNLKMNNNYLGSVILPRNTSTLRFLDYHSNRITEFSGLDDSGALEFVDLSDNDLRTVAGFLFRGIKLLKLANFSQNSIETIDHRAFLPLSPLIIDVSHNLLKNVHYNNWVATQELYLNHNEIAQIDSEAFRGMTSLKKLDLSQNRLFTIHETLFKDLINLIHLNLSHNYLDSMQCINHLDQLEILDLGHNNISHLGTSTFLPIPKVKTLYLQTNLLRTIIPTIFRDASDLKEVDLSNNPFDCSCDTLAFKDWLRRTKISVSGLYLVNSTAYHCRSPAGRVGVHVLHWSEDDFECSSSVLYLIIVCSIGSLFIVAGVASSVTYRFYKRWKQKVQQAKKEKEEKEKQEVKKMADMVRLSNLEIAQAIQEAIDRKHRQYSRIHEAVYKQNNYITPSRQTQRNTYLAKSKDDSKDTKRKHHDDKNAKKEEGRSRTKKYDKLKKDELNKEELEKQQEKEKVGGRDKQSDMRRSERSQQRDEGFDHYQERHADLVRELQHRYRNPHSESQRINQNRLFDYAYGGDSRHRNASSERSRRNGPYIISPAYTYYDVQDSTNWRHASQAETLQESRLPHYQVDGYNTMPAADRGRSYYGRDARVREKIPEHRHSNLPYDASFADEEALRYYEKNSHEHQNGHHGHQRSQSYNLLPEDYTSQRPYRQRDRAQRQYERILQTHRHPSQRAASQPVLATDWL